MCWTVKENGFDKSKIEFFGSKFCIGNGYYGYRGCLEEYAKEQLVACTLSEVYDDNGSNWREPINIQNPLHTCIYYKNEPITVLNCDVKAHSQELDIKTGLHTRKTQFITKDKQTISLYSERFASIDNVHLLLMRYSVTADSDMEIILKTTIDMDIWDANGPHYSNVDSFGNDIKTVVSKTIECQKTVSLSECTLLNGQVYESQAYKNNVERSYKITLKKDIPCVLEKYVAICKDTDCADVKKYSINYCKDSAQIGYDKLFLNHKNAWQKRWDDFDIKIDGDEKAQLAVRYSMYLLLISSPFHTDMVAIPARGLSGQVYKGGMFWDTEIYMLQMFAYCHPDVAKNLMMYRVHNLKGAIEKAQEYGYKGAFYPWESQETGKDGCTHYNLVDIFTGRKMRTYFRDKQIHISADVVYGLWKYAQITGDDKILLHGGAEVIVECARFFCSYGYYKVEKQRYELLDVTGADEYHERVNNDAYTNYMVKLCLQSAVETLDYLQENHNALYEKIVSNFDSEEELKLIYNMNEKIYLPQPNNEGVIEQYDGYFKQEDLSIEELYSRIIKPNEYLGSPCGLAVNTQIIKQADVVLLLCMMGEQFSTQIKEKNWTYYEPRTEHGSSLSTCIYALLAAQIGKTDWAYRYLMKAAQIDLNGNYKLYLGDLYIGGTHPAANGGTWMVTVLGFGGLHIKDGIVNINPKLPENWNSMSYHFYYNHNGFNTSISRKRIEITPDKQNKNDVQFCINDKNYICTIKEGIKVNF
ncbi:glycoside hydrolase family 65 protein [Paludicola sp. MB14-C6]|uniref:glycosyl hydrolase family 65 protein n=1 Tax=Paludihabitans sp. MB14-C6 TaxID=3070656 RepID=UPI0027DB5B6B|nr:glycosyl hydrolase family 65 protein [Paludicola sp. MB14-C6]WMJ22741.1 glycoside hydrolase family 65 protein [Paludicola sp. MB14-C6]